MRRSGLPLIVLACMMAACAQSDPTEIATSMTDDTQAKVASKAQAEQQWQPDDVVVEPLDGLSANGCSLYAASHRTQPMSYTPSYAVLGDGQVVSESDQDAARRILDACGAQAGAGLWAEIVARFHPDAAPGTVLYEAKAAQIAVQKAAQAGHPFSEPAFAPGPDKTVEFYLMNFESGHLYRVKATRRGDGAIEVAKTRAS